MKTMTARDVMSSPVLTIEDSATIEELSTLLTENAISGVPVVDGRGRLVGVVTLTDIAEQAPEGEGEYERPGWFHAAWRDRLNPEDLQGLHVEERTRLVRDIMTPAVYTVPQETPVREVARTMTAGRIHRLLVTSEGRVVGIVSALDLLKLLIEPVEAKRPLRGLGPAGPPARKAARKPGRTRRSRRLTP